MKQVEVFNFDKNYPMQDLAQIRTEYSRHSLDEKSILASPFGQFEKWFNEAIGAKVLEPNAMNLATVTVNNRPSSRIVLLKGFDEQGFSFYTNYQSNKGKELEQTPFCALSFFWPELERQVRIEGAVERVSAEQSDKYFKSRPRESQVGAWASPQSSVIASRQLLEDRYSAIDKKFEGKNTLTRPNQWGGYLVKPFLIEFWQGRPSRLHDRILYTLTDGKWKVSRLAP
jgi:pyridoxamine 5'-phosphate oxidase